MPRVATMVSYGDLTSRRPNVMMTSLWGGEIISGRHQRAHSYKNKILVGKSSTTAIVLMY